MRRFDPRERRRFLLENIGYRSYLAEDTDELRRNSSLCAMASSALTDAIYCILVGLDEPARQQLRPEYPAEHVAAATRQVLDIQTHEWLGSGHARDAVRWLKIVYWNLAPNAERPSWEVALKAYDHLPGVRRPTNEPERSWWQFWRR